MCKILCVSEAGYYKYKRNLGKSGKDETLSAAIKSIIDESEYNDNLGVQRMQLTLMQRDIKAGIRRITRLMREMGLIHKPHRKPKGLTRATTEAQERENLIKQDFSADKPLKKLLTDISQIQCEDGNTYNGLLQWRNLILVYGQQHEEGTIYRDLPRCQQEIQHQGSHLSQR